MVLGTPAWVLQDVDEKYERFLALCESNKRSYTDQEKEMLIKQAQYSGETPPAGPKAAVLFEVRDKGIMKGFKGEDAHKIDLAWQIADRDSTGRRFTIVQRCNAIWGTDKLPSNLRKAIDMVRVGLKQAPITNAESEDGIDTDQYIGANATLMLVHNPGQNGKVFANVKLVMPPSGEKLVYEAPDDSNGAVRVDRAQAQATATLRAVAAASEAPEGEDRV
jgi:hypothetical protein